MKLRQNFSMTEVEQTLRKEKLVHLAKKMLDGRLDLIEGCHQASALIENSDLLTNRLNIFLMINHYYNIPLKVKNIEYPNNNIILVETLFKTRILESCRWIMRNFMTPKLEAQFDLVESAKEILKGRVEILSSVRGMYSAIMRLIAVAPEYEHNPIFERFLDLSSGLEGYPFPDDLEWRSLYDPEMLKESDKVIDEYREDIRKEVLEDCRELIRMFD